MEPIWLVIPAAVVAAFFLVAAKGGGIRLREEQHRSVQSATPEVAPPPAPALPDDERYAQQAAKMAAERDCERQAVKRAHNDHMEPIRQKLEHAQRVISESGVDTALSDILEIMQYWPSWSKRQDWEMPFAVEGIDGGHTDGGHTRSIVEASHWLTWVWQGMRFRLQLDLHKTFIIDSDDDGNHHGEIHLWANEEKVIGLDVSRDLLDDCDKWRMFGVSTFRAGPWMSSVTDLAGRLRIANDERLRKHERDFYSKKADQIDI